MADGTELSERDGITSSCRVARSMRGFSPHSSSHTFRSYCAAGDSWSAVLALARKRKAEASAAFVSIGGNESTTMCGDDRLAPASICGLSSLSTDGARYAVEGAVKYRHTQISFSK